MSSRTTSPAGLFGQHPHRHHQQSDGAGRPQHAAMMRRQKTGARKPWVSVRHLLRSAGCASRSPPCRCRGQRRERANPGLRPQDRDAGRIRVRASRSASAVVDQSRTRPVIQSQLRMETSGGKYATPRSDLLQRLQGISASRARRCARDVFDDFTAAPQTLRLRRIQCRALSRAHRRTDARPAPQRDECGYSVAPLRYASPASRMRSTQANTAMPGSPTSIGSSAGPTRRTRPGATLRISATTTSISSPTDGYQGSPDG